MTRPWDGVLVRFGELGIKSQPVRRQMTLRLRENLFDGMLRDGLEGDAAIAGSRLWLAGPDPDALCDLATRTFGVVSASPVCRVEADLDVLGEVAAELALRSDWESFAIRANRDGKHSFSSQDIGIQVGSAVFKAAEAAGRAPRVDLGMPDLEVHVEVRGKRGFVFLEKRPGPGGLPLGSQGKVVALVCDPASFVAAWLMMRRGCHVVLVHAGTMGSQPLECLEALRRWGAPTEVELLPVCSGTVSKPVLLEAAAHIAQEVGAQAVVTGDTLTSDLTGLAGQVVLRPVCGLAPDQLDALVARIGLVDETEDLLDEGATETLESLLEMRRTVT